MNDRVTEYNFRGTKFFYIDVEGLSKGKAERFLKREIEKFKKKQEKKNKKND